VTEAATAPVAPHDLRQPDPTLLELARGGSAWAKVGLGVIVAGALLGLASITVLRPGKAKGGAAHVTVAATATTPGIKLDYARGELRVVARSPQRIELTDKKAGDPQGSVLLVTPLQLASYKGSPTGALPLASVKAQASIAARFDAGSTRFVDEGLVNIGPNPGYQLSYVATRKGATWFGRAAIVVQDTDAERRAVLMDGEEQRVPRGDIVGPRSVGRVGDLRRPMRSLVFTK
jgi:hypothetical protein